MSNIKVNILPKPQNKERKKPDWARQLTRRNSLGSVDKLCCKSSLGNSTHNLHANLVSTPHSAMKKQALIHDEEKKILRQACSVISNCHLTMQIQSLLSFDAHKAMQIHSNSQRLHAVCCTYRAGLRNTVSSPINSGIKKLQRPTEESPTLFV